MEDSALSIFTKMPDEARTTALELSVPGNSKPLVLTTFDLAISGLAAELV